ncbi:hypothetical protein CVT24_002006 [Panaeolus cyanescens]|uniref:Ribosomal protein L7/L12 C-terminal domain-containing protein n=1 Tax=Panaeolus cyanescens TaxID=181874 RepID=A0A409YHF7_9AGAR|nr:hypothetical protein CVT24_002006 [Panaeolus cyanescens]
MSAPSSVPPVNIVRGTNNQLIAFLVLNMWPSHFGLPVLLAIVLFSKRVKRHAIFVNLLLAFIIAGVVYANATTGPEPNELLCLFQSSLLYGMPGLQVFFRRLELMRQMANKFVFRTSTAALTLVIQMFLMIRAAFFGEPYHDSDHMLRLWLLLIAPYMAFFTAILSTAIIGVRDPTKVSRNRRFFYCSVENLALTNTLTIYAAIVLFATLVFIVWTCVIVYKRWKALRSQGLELRNTVDLSFPTMASRCSSLLRNFARPSASTRYTRAANSSRWLATAAEAQKSTPTPPPSAAQAAADPTIERIVNDISGLTLLQAADLVTLLKSRLNIQEIAMPAASAAPAAAAAPAAEEPEAAKPKEKTVFNVKLESFDAASKPKVIKEVKALVPNLTLMEAKKFVESLPQVLKENLSKEDAEKMQKVFEGIGAVVKLD